MPDYTLKDIDDMHAKGVITKQDRTALRMDFFQQANQEEGTVRKLIGHLSHEITEGWAAIKAGTKAGAKSESLVDEGKAYIQVVAGALQVLSALPTAAGKVGGASVQDYLMQRGANPTVAALAGTVADIAANVIVPVTGGAGVVAKAAKGAAAATATRKAASDATVRKGIADWMEETLLVDKTAAATKTVKTADDKAKAVIDAVNKKVEKIDEAGKLLDEVAKGTDEAGEASATIDDAMGALIGKGSSESVAKALSTRARGPVRDFNRMAEELAAPAIRGGREFGGPEAVGASARARQAFDEGAAKYEASRIKLADLEAKAKESNTSIADVLALEFGQAKTPQEIANLSQPVKFYGEAFTKSVDRAEDSLAKGDYKDFWQAMTEMDVLVRVHWPYMAPRQVAGQGTKTYDEPVLSATRFLQQVPALGSWMGKLKMSTPDEVEAMAPFILREMQKIKSPEAIANYSKRVATEMADKGDEVLHDPTFRDKAHFWFVNSIMSGTDTIGRNLAGNTLAVPWHYAEKITGAAAGKVLNPFLKAEHKLQTGTFSEANAGMSIWFRSMWDASRYAMTRKFDDLHGMIPDEQALQGLLTNRYDLHKKFSNTGTTNPLGTGTFARAAGTPVSISQTADEVSRIAVYRMAVGEKVYQDWAASGSGLNWRQYFDEAMNNVPPSAHEYGVRLSSELTFSDAMSRFGRTAMQVRENLPGSEFIATFIKTVDRLTAFQYNRTPIVGAFSKRLWDELRSDDPLLKAEALGRLTFSSILGAGLFGAARTMAPDGMPLLTGGGPTDRQLAMKMKDSKTHMPYTFWTPAGRMGYAYLAPMRGPLGMVADASEIFDEIRNPEDGSALLSGILLAGTRNYFEMSYTKQFSDIFNIWDKPSGSSGVISRMSANLVKGFIEPSIVRQIFREIDPNVKETHGFIDELAREIPGWGLPARRNPLTGEPVMNPPRMLADVPGLNWFLPTSPVQPASDAFANKIRELKLKMPDFPSAFAGSTASESPFAYSGPLGEAREARSGVPIPDHLKQKGMDYAFGAEDFGQTLNDEMNALVGDPEFGKLAPIDQAEAIRAGYHARYGVALERLKSENPELMEAYEVKMQRREAVRMPPEEREAFEQTIRAPEDPAIRGEDNTENFSLLPE